MFRSRGAVYSTATILRCLSVYGLLIILSLIIYYCLLQPLAGEVVIAKTEAADEGDNNETRKGDDDKHYVVPNIVHFTWYSRTKLTFRFHHLISLLSAYRIVKAETIFFWYETEPQGVYWWYATDNVPVIKMMYRKAPDEIYGIKIKVDEHHSDIVRLEALMQYGGMYYDLDAVAIRSFGPLRNYDMTIGLQKWDGLCNGVMVAKPNATFLKLWHKTYKTFDDSNWAGHSVAVPWRLWRNHPDLVHVEKDTMNRPNFKRWERKWIYKKGYILRDWQQKYTMHLWYRLYNKDHTPEDIKTLNSTLGEIFRYVYYGDPKIIKPL